MYYRLLIQVLESLLKGKSFSTADVMAILHTPGLLNSESDVGDYLRSKFPVSQKMISKDLEKLYHMGFLSRTKQRRQVKTKTGKICYKGFANSYVMTKQGHSYVNNYLWNPNPPKPKRELRDRIDLYMHELIVRKTKSPEMAEAAWAFYRGIHPQPNPRPIELRFPIKRDPLLIELLRRTAKERDEFKAELPKMRKQIEELQTQIYMKQDI